MQCLNYLITNPNFHYTLQMNNNILMTITTTKDYFSLNNSDIQYQQ